MTSRRSGADLVACATLVGLDVAVIVALWPTLVRPLWYDEAWRAYHISVGAGWFETLRTANAPLSFGWFTVEKLAVTVGGNTEGVLRLPQIVALIALSLFTYALGRWWLSRPAATIVAGLLSVNGGLLVYGMQLKSYLPEATCAVATLYLWLRARRAVSTGGSPWRAQLGMAVCAVMSVTSLFVLAPLLLLDVLDVLDARRVVRAGRVVHSRRPAVLRLVGSVLVGATGAVHLALFVLPQSYLAANPYWRNFFITRNNAVGQLRTAGWELPRNAFTAAMTRPDGQFGSPFTGSPLLADPDQRLHVCVVAGALLCWAVGSYVAARDRAGRALLVALGGTLLLIVLASARGQWPVGFVRANLFVLPLLYVVAGIGASALVGLARARIRRSVMVIPVLAVPLAVVVAAAVAVTAVSTQRILQIRASANGPLLLGDMRELVATAERTARPGDIQIVIPGRWDERQWYKAQQYYVSYYNDYPASASLAAPIAEVNTLVLPPLGWNTSIPPFLAARPDAGALYLITYNLVFPDSLHSLDSMLAALGWCPDDSGRRSWPLTGQLTRFIRCPPSTTATTQNSGGGSGQGSGSVR
ncbi:glycosyltransferase family 39 protein [Frankia sp. Cas4]|uniref:glycosyltransferase family 39 protein n=1 Tax=Frankia sp. Cas4 TaxID=3073927 RepID=UPI002AD2611D|nr:glycosyltransferase family 39 protein [Frankia sp. Cas4]